MKVIKTFEIKDRKITIGQWNDENKLVIFVTSLKTLKILSSFNIPLSLEEQALEQKSYTALLRFAKENNKTDEELEVLADEQTLSESESNCPPHSEATKVVGEDTLFNNKFGTFTKEDRDEILRLEQEFIKKDEERDKRRDLPIVLRLSSTEYNLLVKAIQCLILVKRLKFNL